MFESYYLSTILGMIGYNTTYAKTRINMSNQCWGFINGTIASLVVTRFPRRKMFLLCTISMLLVFVGWTVSMQQVLEANAAKKKNNSAAIAVLFFIYAYSPGILFRPLIAQFSTNVASLQHWQQRPNVHLPRGTFPFR